MFIKQRVGNSKLIFYQGNGNKGKNKSSRNSAQAAIIRIVAWTVATVVVFVVVYSKDVFHKDPCEAPLVYQADNLNEQSAIKKLMLRENAETDATRLIEGAALKLISQSQQLCHLYQQGRIENQVYVERQKGLSRQFALLVQLQQQMPAFSVGKAQLADYRQKIAQINK